MVNLTRILLLLALLTTPVTAQESQQWMIMLDEPPAAVVWAESLAQIEGDEKTGRGVAKAAVNQHLQEIESSQQQVLAALAATVADARVVFRVQKVLNGISVLAPAERVDVIRGLPGVREVRPVVPKHLTNSSSVPFLGTPTLWDGGGLGVTGSGVTIGIIDTGIDYIHTTFGGSGLAADYATNDSTTIADGFFPTAKIAGGFDFVGDDYDASDPDNAVPAPDDDPFDCNAHGTHVAGTAAGFGTDGGGATYVGGYGPGTDFGALTVGPGVAPEATLYALKVFGCSGETAVVEQALEWAIDPDDNGDFSDHLDVVNLSLTSPVGAEDDPTSIAADNAVLAGVIVVAAAGNDGSQHFIVGSPATADRAIAVAASWGPPTTPSSHAPYAWTPPREAPALTKRAAPISVPTSWPP